MTIDPMLRQTLIDASQLTDVVQPQGYQPEDINLDHDDRNNSPLSEPAKEQRRQLASPVNLLYPYILQFVLLLSIPPNQTQSTQNDPEAKLESGVQKQSTKEVAAGLSDGRDGSKRYKYLERNRMAALKWRQKKRFWIKDLETYRSELENKHKNLQHESKSLVYEVMRLKTSLMAYAGCGDPRIDGWIETESKRFMQKNTDAVAGIDVCAAAAIASHL